MARLRIKSLSFRRSDLSYDCGDVIDPPALALALDGTRIQSRSISLQMLLPFSYFDFYSISKLWSQREIFRLYEERIYPFVLYIADRWTGIDLLWSATSWNGRRKAGRPTAERLLVFLPHTLLQRKVSTLFCWRRENTWAEWSPADFLRLILGTSQSLAATSAHSPG
jgi:hypothetical protein